MNFNLLICLLMVTVLATGSASFDDNKPIGKENTGENFTKADLQSPTLNTNDETNINKTAQQPNNETDINKTAQQPNNETDINMTAQQPNNKTDINMTAQQPNNETDINMTARQPNNVTDINMTTLQPNSATTQTSAASVTASSIIAFLPGLVMLAAAKLFVLFEE